MARLGAMPGLSLTARSLLPDRQIVSHSGSLSSRPSALGLTKQPRPKGRASPSSLASLATLTSAAVLARCSRSAQPRAAQRGVAVCAASQATEVSYLKSKVEEMAALQPVMVFSKSWCPFCAKAKEALQQQGIKFAVCELDNLGPEVEAEVQDVLAGITGARTVPRVFIGGKCIGGGSDTERLAAEGTLKQLADEAMDTHRTNLAGGGAFQLSKPEEDWKASLDPQLFRILRQRGTEPPGSHEYDQFLPKAGHFSCAGCGLPLYSAQSKFASSCGWPVFNKCYNSKDLGQHVLGRPDGTGSLEIVCTRCGSHLGHVFYDSVSEDNPNGERH